MGNSLITIVARVVLGLTVGLAPGPNPSIHSFPVAMTTHDWGAPGGSACPGTGTPCTDSFARANGPLGSNWTQGPAGSFDGITVDSNAAAQTTFTGHPGLAYWSATPSTPWTANQYAQVHLVTSTDKTGVVLRAQDANNMYFVTIPSTASASVSAELHKLVAGTDNYISAWVMGSTVAAGDTYRVEVIGSTFTLYQNGVSAGTLSDTTYSAAGPAGIVVMWNSGQAHINNFQANNCTTTCPTN